jgi:DNA-binding CsgD family transcriptional regulator
MSTALLNPVVVVGPTGHDGDVPRYSTPLVGRTDELAVLLSSLGLAGGRRARRKPLVENENVVIIDGDAGIGKTRLLSEVVDRVELGRSHLTLIGHCIDLGEAPPPLLPFRELFTRLAHDREAVVDALRGQFPALGRLLPTADPSRPEDRVERGELFHAVLAALEQLGTMQPVLMVIEDVHWADQASRDLLGFLFARAGSLRDVVIMASFRSDDLHRRHPLRASLAEWSRLPAVRRLSLDGLDPDHVRSLIGALAAAPLAEDDLRSIVERADGNAFFAEELVAAAESCGAQYLPWHLADLLLVRLDRLSPDAREVVRVAAVAGKRVSHELLERVVDLPSPEFDAAVRGAVDQHILEPLSSGRGYVFRHALLAEAIYDDLLPGERIRIHAAFADVLAERGHGSAAELARHAHASHDLPTAYVASLRAGEEAMSIAAPQEAMHHYELALELAPHAPPGAIDAAALTPIAVEAAVAAGHISRGLKMARAGLAALPADAPTETRAALLYSVALAAVAGEVDDSTLDVTAEALALVPAEPATAFWAQLAAMHAQIAFILGRDAEAEQWANRAIEAAEQVGRREIGTAAQTTLAIMARRHGNPAAATKLMQRAADAAKAAGDLESEMRSHYALASLHYELAQFDAARTSYETCVGLATSAGRRWSIYGVTSAVTLAMIEFLGGRFDEAMAAVDFSGEAPPADAAAHLLSMQMRIRAARGDASALDFMHAIRQHWARDGRVALYSTYAAVDLYEQQGESDRAIAIIDDLVELLGPLWLDTWFLGRIELSARAVGALCVAAQSAPQARRGQLLAAGRKLTEDGRTTAERGIPRGGEMGPEGQAWLLRLEAEWARLRWLCDLEAPPAAELIGAWQRCVEAFGFGADFEVARSRARLAAVLRGAGRTVEATEQAQAAFAVAQRAGAQGLLAELRALGLNSARIRAADEPAALTEREREVLELIAEGRTNRQIASQLFISDKTVSVHVSNMMAKLGARTRTEAASIARQAGLLPQVVGGGE